MGLEKPWVTFRSSAPQRRMEEAAQQTDAFPLPFWGTELWILYIYLYIYLSMYLSIYIWLV